MSRSRRSTAWAPPLGAAALAIVLAASPAAASNVDPKSPRTPQSVSTADVKNKTAQAMPGPRKPGWVERMIGRLVPKPPRNTCRG